jgi:tetratricopeptide (TPR) repeat protein
MVSKGMREGQQVWGADGFTTAEIKAQAARISNSPTFLKSKRLARFLAFVVENTLAGKESALKETVLGLEVFDRRPDFDPKTDPIVRVDARRLRSRLAEYYQGLGAADPVVIELEPGSYVPRFRRSDIAPEGGTAGPFLHAPKPVRKLVVLDLLRRARKEVQEVSTPEGVVKALHLFQRAADTNPDHHLAHTGIAIASFWMAMFGCEHASTAFTRAKAAALRAVELDPSSSESQAVLGLLHTIYDHDFRAANAVFLLAARLNPTSSAVQYARALAYLAPMGSLDEAAGIITLVLQKDPRPRYRFGLGWIRYLQRDWQTAVDELLIALRASPRFLPARFLLVLAYEQLARFDAAAAMFDDAEMRTAYPLMAVRQDALALLRAGKREEAALVASRMEAEYTPGVSDPMLAGAVFAALGDTDRTFEWLNRALVDCRFWLIYLKSDPSFDSIRADLRYADLLARIGLSDADPRPRHS